MPAPTHNTLDRTELQKIIELCADTITEISCLMMDSTAPEILERLEGCMDALHEARGKVLEQNRTFRSALAGGQGR